jgi:hypothetical protein
MSAIPYVHHRRHYTIPDLTGSLQEDDRQTEADLFKADSASEAMAAFYATIVNGTPNIDANWIASHPAGLRNPKNPGQIGITNPTATSNQVGAPLSPALMVVKKV